ncbi:MAG: EFR1 family ferrodoxin [Bacteroidales bacterium]|nr:EFR1 family ferrodoxin [Bacteroidales bacterium]MCF8457738.1 EFR1 family ferrodoxin [Bacteroidales bacterium]
MERDSKVQYDQLIIYYFSGTGNARNAARWIQNTGQQKGVSTQLINIDRFDKIEVPGHFGKILIGFCCPTHGFNLPPLMLKFIFKFPKRKNCDVFLLNTRGGLKLYNWHVPGLSGVAQILPAIILWIKGFKVVGMRPLDLPSNWLILHPGLTQKAVTSIYQHCQPKVQQFTLKIVRGKKDRRALWTLPIDILLIPIAIGYYFIGRFFLAKTLIATDTCNNCDVCISKCPVEAIVKVNERPFWTYRCESCMRCVNICPQRAIETTHGYSTLVVFVSSLVISPFLMAGIKKLGAMDFFLQSVLTEKILTLINAFFFLVFVILSYGVLHFFMRFKFVSRIIAFTSLSKYRFWRRYKAPKQVV